MTKAANRNLILALDPTYRGFGFVIMEGPASILEWGIRSSRVDSIEREQELLSKIAELISRYHPYSLLLEKHDWKDSRRCGRVRLLIAGIQNEAIWEGIRVKNILPANIQKVFSTFRARTKHDISCVVAQQIPQLALFLPPKRKPWMNEDYQMPVFDAAALALTYFYTRRSGRRSEFESKSRLHLNHTPGIVLGAPAERQ